MFDVRSRQDVHRALQLAGQHGLKGTLHGANLSGEIAETIQQAGFSVVYRPFGANTSGRTLDATVQLAEAGVPFGFGLDAPDRDELTLRYSAALCVRAGVEPATAWKALTADAAGIAGVSERLGQVAPGQDADLVLWSGNPLDLGSSVSAVYVNGNLVDGGDQ
jgi:imidazolonepropionase-like amidohydrolase